jgi:hypothetical protein
MRSEIRVSKKPLSKADRIIEEVGIGMVEVVKAKYDEYLAKPNKKNALEYCKWRLRLHRKLNNDRDRLEEVNTARSLGLYDENPGPLCFDLVFDDVFLRREFG